MRQDIAPEFESPVAPQFDTLIIVDQRIDLTKSVVKQQTYKGLFDELYGSNKVARCFCISNLIESFRLLLKRRYRKISYWSVIEERMIWGYYSIVQVTNNLDLRFQMKTIIDLGELQFY